MIHFDLFIAGTPKAQPRPKAFCRGKRAGVYNPTTADAWKQAIKDAVKGLDLGKCPVGVILNFEFERPKSHYGSRKGVKYIKESSPEWHTQKPDLDNLAKAVLDAVGDAGAWHDDAQVTYLKVTKEWSMTGGVDMMIFDALK